MVKEYGCHGADKMIDYWSALKDEVSFNARVVLCRDRGEF